LPDDMVDDAVGYDAPDSLSDELADPLRSQ
jgi:hypothetical protein